MFLVTDYLALGCLILALTILQKSVRPQTPGFRRFLRAMWAVTALLLVMMVAL